MGSGRFNLYGNGVLPGVRLFTLSCRATGDCRIIATTKGGSMPDFQIAQIKALEETVRQLVQQAANMREEATKMEDTNLRETLLKAANECEEGARNLANGLRGMRKNLQ